MLEEMLGSSWKVGGLAKKEIQLFWKSSIQDASRVARLRQVASPFVLSHNVYANGSLLLQRIFVAGFVYT